MTLKDAPITRTHATTMLRYFILRQYLPAVLKLCPNVDSPERLAALIDFCYNLGSGNLSTSTLRKRVNSEQWGEVPEQLRRWVRANGKVLQGLVLRREDEISYI